jgi:hypothetical protein
MQGKFRLGVPNVWKEALKFHSVVEDILRRPR